MVGNLSASQHITFSPWDIPKEKSKHNDPLYLEVFIHKAKVRCLLIDGGAGLNICTLKVVNNLGYSEDDVDPSRRITIKAYDDSECFSKGIIMLLVRVGLATKDTLFHVLDIEMNCNMILGCPWLHAMKAVPSTYHQCLKFSYHNIEVTIPGDPDPF